MEHVLTCTMVYRSVHVLYMYYAQYVDGSMHITMDKELLTDGCTNILSVDYSVGNNYAPSTTGPVINMPCTNAVLFGRA